MGRPKPLLPLPSGETFVGRLVRVLHEGGAEDVLVVVGHEAGLVRAAVEQDRVAVRLIENPRYDEGQLSSLVVALGAVERPGVTAVLVIPVDMPLVSAATVRAVTEAYRRTAAPIVRPVREGRHGHPVLFDRRLFAELRRADPSIGARAVVRAHAEQVLDVPVEDEGAFIDIDTPEAYAHIVGGDVSW